LYWCLDPIRHNIGTPLKHNKYIFDIPISGVFVIIFTYLQLLSNISQNLQATSSASMLFTCAILTIKITEQSNRT
jgi:hypothetical protein